MYASIKKQIRCTIGKNRRANKGQWKVFPVGKLVPTDPPPTAEACLKTIRLLIGQLTG